MLLTALERKTQWLTRAFNWAAAAAVIVMMLLTCADVLLRLIRHPIPGTYEIVGLLGAVFASFSLAYTSMQRGHIAVDFLVQKFSPQTRLVVEISTSMVSTVLFALVTWQSILYAQSLRRTGEVSMTLQMPLYPFVWGIALGSAMLCLVLLMRVLTASASLGAKE